MKKYLIIIAVLSSAFMLRAAEAPNTVVPVKPDTRDARIEELTKETDNYRKACDAINEKLQKMTNQRNQLAAGLLDMQQILADTQATLGQTAQALSQANQSLTEAKAKLETPKPEVKKS